jgi:hypothetical protein
MNGFPARVHVKVFTHDANYCGCVAGGGEHPAQEKELFSEPGTCRRLARYAGVIK